MISLSVFSFAYAGLALLGLAMRRQRGAEGPGPGPIASVCFRILGAALIALSFFVATRPALDLGIVEWVGALGLSGIAFIVCRTASPGLATASAVIAPALGAAIWLLILR